MEFRLPYDVNQKYKTLEKKCKNLIRWPIRTSKGIRCFNKSPTNHIENSLECTHRYLWYWRMLEKAKSELLPRFHSKIDFHGYLDRSTLDFYYENCDVFVAPSRYESFGIIYLEAMKFSKPIIACDSGGTPEVVSDGRTGILVKPGDFHSLAVAVIKLSNNPVLRKEMGEQGRTLSQNFFQWMVSLKIPKDIIWKV